MRKNYTTTRNYLPRSSKSNVSIMEMKKQIAGKTIHAILRTRAIAVFLALIACAFTSGAQTLSYPLNNGFFVNVHGVGPTICNPTTAFSFQWPNSFIWAVNPTFINNGSNQWSNDERTYHIAQAGMTKQIIVDIPNAGGLNMNSTLLYNFGQFDGDPNTQFLQSTAENIDGSPYPTLRHVLNINFPRGMMRGYLSFAVRDLNWPAHIVVIPFVVEGPINPGEEVDIIDTTVDPQIPYLVLHAPPGDGSSSKFENNKTTCRNFQSSYTSESSNAANAAVKIGVAGQAGIFVTTSFEFSVTMSAGFETGDMSIVTTDDKTCITVSEGFETSALTDSEGGGDIFIGFGNTLALGLYERLRINESTCQVIQDMGLIYAPLDTTQFIYTRTNIEQDITAKQAIADDPERSVRERNNAQNQIDVWNQVLEMNTANINNPDNQPLGPPISFGGLTSRTVSTSIAATQTNTIEYQHYIGVSAGLQAVIEVGGSGISGGYQYKASKRFGETQNQSDESATLISYTLSDKDPGDLFNVQVVRDPMYGTPIFRLLEGTKSSCPYQGGYQRDQPLLNHSNITERSIVAEDIPMGNSFTFPVDLCNESNETRTYNLKLNAASNLNGAVVSASGVPLNGNDLGQSFSIPAGTCLEDVVVNVSRLNASSPMAYPNLELFLYAPCEETIQSSISASVSFIDVTSTEDLTRNLPRVSVFPNPASQTVTLDFELMQSATVNVEIYDLVGKIHKVSIQEQLTAGRQLKTVDVSQLPVGVYMLRIQNGPSEFLTQKLVISQ